METIPYIFVTCPAHTSFLPECTRSAAPAAAIKDSAVTRPKHPTMVSESAAGDLISIPRPKDDRSGFHMPKGQHCFIINISGIAGICNLNCILTLTQQVSYPEDMR